MNYLPAFFRFLFGQMTDTHNIDAKASTLRSAAPLDQNLCARLLASLQPDYEGFELKIKNLFGYAMLDEHALRILLEDMKRDGVPINGFLDRSSITITGQNITVVRADFDARHWTAALRVLLARELQHDGRLFYLILFFLPQLQNIQQEYPASSIVSHNCHQIVQRGY